MELIDRNQIIQEFKVHTQDTGSSEVQITILTTRINHLTNHLRTHRKDCHSRRGLIRMTNCRRKHLNYLKRRNIEKYRNLLQRLKLRR